MPTRDGISEEDWAKVRAIAVDIANRAGHDLDTNMLENHLQECLDQLELKYGMLPSILATRADYADDPIESLTLYKAAYAKACEVDNKYEKTDISSSIAEMYIETIKDDVQGREWLGKLESNMKFYSDKDIKELHDKLSHKVKRPPSL